MSAGQVSDSRMFESVSLPKARAGTHSFVNQGGAHGQMYAGELADGILFGQVVYSRNLMLFLSFSFSFHTFQIT